MTIGEVELDEVKINARIILIPDTHIELKLWEKEKNSQKQ